MRYTRVCIDGLGYDLPGDRVSSAEIERQLAPVYERLKMPQGRLEFMTGIRERRFYAKNASITDVSARTAQRAISASGIERSKIGALVHGSVCRDFLEPATACGVHAALELPADCAVYDVSNACLGILHGATQIANLIELGAIEAGVVVGTENGRALLENTIEQLNTDATLTRASIKHLVASLTIGSASAAIVLCDASISRSQNRLLAATGRAETRHHHLCQSDGLHYTMRTDSEALMHAGVETGERTFSHFLREAEWRAEDIDKTICHQVGAAHRDFLLSTLAIAPEKDFATFQSLGNTGAAALPVALAIGLEQGHVGRGDRAALLGIGSGVNCLMLATEWNDSGIVVGAGLDGS